MKALAQRLRPDGVVAVMLYAKYGSLGIELLETIFRDLRLEQDDASVRVVKETISLLPAAHPARGYLNLVGNVQHDAVLVDTFLHGRARNYTVDDCLDLVGSAGLEFQSWLLKSPCYHHDLLSSSTEFAPAISRLPEAKLWSVMERVHTTNACHFFIACHPQRPKESYVIDFSTMDCLDYVPLMRMRCGLSGSDIYRSDWRKTLNSAQLPLVQHVDGQRTIRQIAASVHGEASSRGSIGDVEKFAIKLFQALWRFDFLTMALSSGSQH